MRNFPVFSTLLKRRGFLCDGVELQFRNFKICVEQKNGNLYNFIVVV
jgi:hypothetical protein